MPAIFTDTVSRAVIGTFGTALCAGICLIGATAPAAAAEAPRAQLVRYSDLNLASAAGREALALRIRHAARNVCETGSHDLGARSAQARCIRTAVDGAVAKMASMTPADQG
jgi:UrcA family protein